MKMRKFRIKYLILAILVLVSIGCIGSFGYLMFRNRQKVERFKTAMSDFEKGNYKQAEIGFQAVLRNDRNNEVAVAKLAELAERRENWPEAAYYWSRATALNAFIPAYFDSAIKTLFKCRDFVELVRLLEQQKGARTISTKQDVILAFSHFMLRNSGAARTLLSQVDRQKQASLPLAKLLELYLQMRTKTNSEIIAELNNLAKSDDPDTSFESLSALSVVYQSEKKIAEAEKSLKLAVELNRFAGLPPLADFYLFRGDHAAAAAAFQEALSFGPSSGIAAKLGEVLAAQKDRAGILKLAESYRSGNRQTLKTGYYLDALAAFLQSDWKTMGESLRHLDGSFNSPPAILMELCLGIYEADPAKAERALVRLNLDNRLKPVAVRALQLTMPFIISLVQQQRIQEAADLARQLQKAGVSDIIVARLVLADNLRQNISVPSEIKRALENFPQDHVLLGVAATDALRAGRYAEALKYAETNQKNGITATEVQLQRAAALEGLNRPAEATAEFNRIISANPDNLELLQLFIDFGVRNKRSEDLKNLVAKINTQEDAKFKQFIPYIEAEIAFLSKDKKLVKFHLKDAKTDRPQLIFRAAVLYGLIDELDAGIATYQKIIDSYPDHGLVKINLSELYAAKGMNQKALEVAEAAWKADPNRSEILECYGIRLATMGNLKEAATILEQSLAKSAGSSERALGAWQTVQEKLIEQEFTNGNYTESRDACRKLLRRSPGHPKAIQYQTKLNEIEKQQKEQG